MQSQLTLKGTAFDNKDDTQQACSACGKSSDLLMLLSASKLHLSVAHSNMQSRLTLRRMSVADITAAVPQKYV